MLERAFSKARLNRYLSVYSGNWNRAQRLYVANLRLSQKLYAILSVFEVSLRNAIDEHYKSQLLLASGSSEWLKYQSGPQGFLSNSSLAKGGFYSRENVKKIIATLGTRYTHDRVVSELNFGFWKYMFAAKEFSAGGNTLLRIFSNRPRGIIIQMCIIDWILSTDCGIGWRITSPYASTEQEPYRWQTLYRHTQV